MSHALVLNASYEPLHIVPWQKAMVLLFQGKVEVVESSDREIRTVSLTFKVPAVLRLLEYVPVKSGRSFIRFSRTNIFHRDHYTCQYCGKQPPRQFLTLDHVIPVVQGGKKTWENIVTSCKTCNQTKGGRTPAEAGMRLLKNPTIPKHLPLSSITLGVTKIDKKWRIYFSVRRGHKGTDAD